MASSFGQTFAVVIGKEGGYNNNLKDPGGETIFHLQRRLFGALVAIGGRSQWWCWPVSAPIT